ncbi:hypothetical protein GGR52DRAFT_180647 [Hypoxylon sp. FL1284]|nr:hypothetical protein GGR52DRAFT_180647 [Hypoxylon sp. FL1284]
MASRPLSSLELYIKVVSDGWKHLDREHWAVYTALQLKFLDPTVDRAACLRRVWQIARYHYPALGAVIADADEASPQSPLRLVSCPLSVDEWADKTFSVRDYEDSNELISHTRPVPTASCYWLPASSELVIRTSHWLMDGLGLFFLSRKLMTALVAVIRLGVDAPLEAYLPDDRIGPPLAPSIDSLSSLRQDPRIETALDQLFSEFLPKLPSIGFPTRGGSLSDDPGPTARVAARLDAEMTTKVAGSCREKGIKVTSAVHAAIVRVTASFPQHPLAKSYAAFALANLRYTRGAGPAWQAGSPEGVAAVCFAGFPVCVGGVVSEDGAALGFDSVAEELNRAYTADLDSYWDPQDGSGQVFGLSDLADGIMRRNMELLKAPMPDGFPPIQTPDLSSLGKVDAHLPAEYGPAGDAQVEISNVWIGTDTVTRNIQFHVWSWKGALNLGACFNTSFYEKVFVSEITSRVLQELVRGCGVDS